MNMPYTDWPKAYVVGDHDLVATLRALHVRALTEPTNMAERMDVAESCDMVIADYQCVAPWHVTHLFADARKVSQPVFYWPDDRAEIEALVHEGEARCESGLMT